MDRVTIFDTTLRDGEQSPGCSMTPRQKLRVARMLAALKVDVIEAGFPAASSGAFDAVQAIAGDVSGTKICALARCHPGDIRSAARALAPAADPRLHVFIATSPIHRRSKLKLDCGQVLQRAVAGVRLARTLAADVEFSAEDAVRTEPEFLIDVLAAVIEAGATTVNIPDTVGYTTPQEIGSLFARLRAEVPGIERVTMSAHCHDDLGMAVANSLAAVAAGARQVECTLNGIGERAGNCALEEVVMALRTRADHFRCTTGIDTRKLYPASRLLAGVTGGFLPRNKAIVGDNAFAHEAGIHQHGMLADAGTYEIMKPEDVGIASSQLVLGRHSGRHAVASRAQALGHPLDDAALDDLFVRFKTLADRKKRVFDADLEALIHGVDHAAAGRWQIARMQVSSGIAGDLATAWVVMSRDDGTTVREAAVGDGPLDATCKAMMRATGIELKLKGLALRSITEGEDAQAEAEIRASWGAQALSGNGLSTDIVAAGAYAFLDILNRVARRQAASAACTPTMARAATTGS